MSRRRRFRPLDRREQLAVPDDDDGPLALALWFGLLAVVLGLIAALPLWIG
jgi:hypothetical protein